MLDTESVPGSDLAEKMSRSCGFWITHGLAWFCAWLFFQFGLDWEYGRIVRTIGFSRSVLFLEFIRPMGIGGLIVATMLAWVRLRYKKAFRTLADAWSLADGCFRNEVNLCKEKKKDLDHCRGFITAFRPSDIQINAVLKMAATKLRIACEAERGLYANGTREYASELPREDASMVNAEAVFTDRLTQCKEAVKAAKTEFWLLWELASKQGYQLESSWKHYANVPSATTIHTSAQ